MEYHWIIAAIFAVSGIACFAGAYRGSRLQNPDASLGLRVLLVVVGLWASLQAIQMSAPLFFTSTELMEQFSIVFFTTGLVVGFATVWAWLWFASAYTGRAFHRDPRFHLAAGAVYLSLTLIKITNPLHGQYFTAELATEPYVRLVIEQQPFYWFSFALAYGLTAVGLYMLLVMFYRSDHSTWTLSGLVLITGGSIIPKVISGYRPDLIPELSYEPVGVAIFALGALYVVEDTFLSLEASAKEKFVQETDEAIITIGTDGWIQDYNSRAEDFIAGLGTTITTVSDLKDKIPIGEINNGARVIQYNHPEGSRYYLVVDREIKVGPHQIGRALLLQDVTVSKQRQQELSRHNEQLEDMTGAIAHELRNTIAIMQGYLHNATDQLEEGNVDSARDSTTVAIETADRMEGVIDELHSLTKYAKSIDEFTEVDIKQVATEANQATKENISLQCNDLGMILADRGRLQYLLENVFCFAAYNKADTVTISMRDDGFTISDNGTHTSSEYGELLFEYEGSAPTSDAGLLLPNVKTIARVHGWKIGVDTDYTAGVRYHITNADVQVDASGRASLSTQD